MTRWFGLLLALALFGCSFNFDRQNAGDSQALDQRTADAIRADSPMDAGPADAPRPGTEQGAAADARRDLVTPDAGCPKGPFSPAAVIRMGGSDSDRGSALTFYNGGLQVTGRSVASLPSGETSMIFLSTLDPATMAGNTVGFTSSGTDSWAEGLALAAGPSDLYLAGQFGGTGLNLGGGPLQKCLGPYTAFIGRFSGTPASYQSAVSTGSSCESTSATAIAVGSDGALYVTGAFKNEVILGPGCPKLVSSGEDIFVAKYSAPLACHWAVKLGGSGDDRGYAIAVGQGSSPSVYVAGMVGAGTPTFGACGQRRVISTTVDKGDVFVVQLDGSNGDCQAADVVGDPIYDDVAYGLALESQGLVVAGYFSGTLTFDAGTGLKLTSAVSPAGGAGSTQDAFVARWKPGSSPPASNTGTWSWATQIGGQGTEVARALAIGPTEMIYVTGRAQGAGTITAKPSGKQGTVPAAGQGDDILVAALDAHGQPLWATAYGGTGGDAGRAVAVRGCEVYVTGWFSDTVSFGAKTLTSVGPSDLFLLKLAPP